MKLLPLLLSVCLLIVGITIFTRRNALSLYYSKPPPPPPEQPSPEELLCNLSSRNGSLSSLSDIRVGKCSALFGKRRPIYERAERTHLIHNKIHGLRPLLLRERLVDDLWNKPAFILSVLLDEMRKPKKDRLHWLLWVDRDTIVLNPCVPVQAFLPPEEETDVHMIVTKDWNGLNNGVFLVRVNQWSIELFSNILGFRYYRPGVELRFTEQSAMEKLLEEDKFKSNTVYVPQRWFNAYQGHQDETLQPHQTRRGDFLVHFAGVGERSKQMEYWLDIAERHAPDWMLEFWRTGYPAEIEEFWTRYANEE